MLIYFLVLILKKSCCHLVVRVGISIYEDDGHIWMYQRHSKTWNCLTLICFRSIQTNTQQYTNLIATLLSDGMIVSIYSFYFIEQKLSSKQVQLSQFIHTFSKAETNINHTSIKTYQWHFQSIMKSFSYSNKHKMFIIHFLSWSHFSFCCCC